jgi:hypothetical protein
MTDNRLQAFGEMLLGKGRTRKATSTRKSSLLRIERDLNIDMDIVVQSQEETQRLRRRIYKDPGYSICQRRNFPNAIKKYFEFINEIELPRLNQTQICSR